MFEWVLLRVVLDQARFAILLRLLLVFFLVVMLMEEARPQQKSTMRMRR